jgi:hypothetical protein
MSFIDQLTELTDLGILSEDFDNRVKYIKQALLLIKENSHLFENKSDYYYWIGYCWYFYPKKTHKRSFEIFFNFSKSIELDNSYEFPKYFLGCFYFDINLYQNAVFIFETINLNYFSNINQSWRVLKIQELICSGKIYLNLLNSVKDDILFVIASYAIDGGNWFATPDELIKALAWYINKDDKLNLVFLSGKLTELIKKLGVLEKFSNEYEQFLNVGL